MKKYIFHITLLLVSFMTILTSCDTDAEGAIYRPENESVGFIVDSSSLELDNSNEFTVEVQRGNASSESIVRLSLEDESGLFSLKSEDVIFAAGSNTTQATICYNYDDLDIVGGYELLLSVANEEQAAQFASSSLSLSVERKLTWEEIGTGIYTSNNFGDRWYQPILRAEENPNVYRLPDCIMSGYPITFVLDEDGELAQFAVQPTGYIYGSYGMLYFYYAGQSMRIDNALYIKMYLVVIYNGGYAPIDDAYWEIIEFPEE